jgi:hypothetical protein
MQILKVLCMTFAFPNRAITNFKINATLCI